jgi:hypothetical protein
MTIRYARLENGVVVEVMNSDAPPVMSPNLIWCEAGPEVREGYVYDGEQFHAPAPPSVDLAAQLAEVDALRKKAYADRADPIFFKWQRGEATQEEWLAAVQDVRAQYPDPVP